MRNRGQGLIICLGLLVSGCGQNETVDVASAKDPATSITTVTTSITNNTQVAPRISINQRVVIIGDSTIASLRWVRQSQVALQGFEATLDAESCRRLVRTNCKSREGNQSMNTVGVILNLKVDTTDILVVGVGYNDESVRFANDFDQVIAAARSRGIARIIWLTYREVSGYDLPGRDYASDYSLMNGILNDKVSSGYFDDVVIADWWSYTQEAPEWFKADGLHYRDVAAFGMADFLSRTIAALDGEPCPQPWSVGEATENPCTRPEVVVGGRQVVDVLSLYEN